MCNPAGGGFRRIVEIRPDPDSRSGYPSIPSSRSLQLQSNILITVYGMQQRRADTRSIESIYCEFGPKFQVGRLPSTVLGVGKIDSSTFHIV